MSLSLTSLICKTGRIMLASNELSRWHLQYSTSCLCPWHREQSLSIGHLGLFKVWICDSFCGLVPKGLSPASKQEYPPLPSRSQETGVRSMVDKRVGMQGFWGTRTSRGLCLKVLVNKPSTDAGEAERTNKPLLPSGTPSHSCSE